MRPDLCEFASLGTLKEHSKSLTELGQTLKTLFAHTWSPSIGVIESTVLRLIDQKHLHVCPNLETLQISMLGTDRFHGMMTTPTPRALGSHQFTFITLKYHFLTQVAAPFRKAAVTSLHMDLQNRLQEHIMPTHHVPGTKSQQRRLWDQIQHDHLKSLISALPVAFSDVAPIAAAPCFAEAAE